MAYIVAILVEDCDYLHLCKSQTAYHRLYVNNAILFEATRDALSRSEIRHVSHGARAMAVNRDGQNRFKSGMDFRLVPHTERVVFNPLVKPLLVAGPLLERIAVRRGTNVFFKRVAKAVALAATKAKTDGAPLAGC